MSACLLCDSGSRVESSVFVFQFDGAPYHRITVSENVDLDADTATIKEELVRCKNAQIEGRTV